MSRSFGSETTIEEVGAVLDHVFWLIDCKVFDQSIDLMLVRRVKRRHDESGRCGDK